jgi:aspartate/methionine/tyrosine aminotransferase
VLKRNNEIIRENHKLLNNWINKEPYINWIPPTAGSVGFMKQQLEVTAKELTLDLIKEKSTFLVPGDCFGHSDHIRIGYGGDKKILKEGLNRLSEYLKQF